MEEISVENDLVTRSGTRRVVRSYMGASSSEGIMGGSSAVIRSSTVGLSMLFDFF